MAPQSALAPLATPAHPSPGSFRVGVQQARGSTLALAWKGVSSPTCNPVPPAHQLPTRLAHSWGMAAMGDGSAGAPAESPPAQHGSLSPTQARAVAPAPTGLLMSIPVYQHIHGQLLKIDTSGTATPAGAPPGSDVPPSPCAAPPNQALGDPAGDLEVSEEMLLQEALRLFGCSLDAVGASQDAPSSSPVPGHPGGTSGEGTGVAPACPVLPTSIPGYQHIQGQLEINSSGTDTPAVAPPGSNIPPGSDVPPSPSAAPHNQALGDPAEDLEVSEEMLLQEALRLFGCSPDTVGASQDAPSSSPEPGHPGGTSGEGTGVAPACPVLLTSIPGYQHIQGQLEINSSVAFAVPDGVLLEEALRLLGCSLDMVGASQDGPSSSPMPGDTGGTGAATPDWDFSPSTLPEELLTPDSCIPELSDTTLSLEIFHGIGMEPQEPREDAGMDLPPSPSAVAEERRKRQAQSSLPMPPSKRRALADNMGV
ncbi:rho GTPase-activating protein 17-like [Harpia harpyja]|uniref:rho GTPase-activating protein 17-like n=1 Tax=Harpia harpyja TaxID=202280 RepID=UPI0022B10084|nr:rho GTPase-activating protein 17-like [Harpia harpyja]